MTERKNAKESERWDLTAIYPDEASFLAAAQNLRALIAAYPENRETMTKSGEGLFRALEQNTAIERLLSRLYEYASLSSDLDKGDNAALARLERVRNLGDEAVAATYFLAPVLTGIPEAELQSFFAGYPALDAYRRQIACIRRYRPHMLKKSEEKLMAGLQPALHSQSEIHSVFSNADLRFGTVKNERGERVRLTSAAYIPLLMSADRNVRRAAFRTLYKTYRQFGNTFAALMNARIKEQVTLSSLRKFPDSLTCSVFDDEVTPAVYHTLIDTVRKNLDPLFDYYDLRREVLGLDRVHLYDVYAPLIPDCDRSYTYAEAVEEVLETVRVLGAEYQSTLERGLKEKRWADVYPGPGKRSGAYSAGCYDTEPYILLNFMGKLDDVSTLAHEAGHSMHTWLANASNSPQNAGYTIFVAEVASTVNELLFTRRLLRNAADKAEKLALLNQLMETYKGTLYRQTMFAEFELSMHTLAEAGEPLTAALLCDRYYQLVRDYFGPRVVCDPAIACEWMRIPHFYNCFYVYKYATCISAASAIVKRIEEEGDAYVPQYLSFLKAGDSVSPVESLRLAGIDPESPKTVEDAVRDFADAVQEFRRLFREG